MTCTIVYSFEVIAVRNRRVILHIRAKNENIIHWKYLTDQNVNIIHWKSSIDKNVNIIHYHNKNLNTIYWKYLRPN